MKRYLAALLLVVLFAVSTAQATVSIVGVWVGDKKGNEAMPHADKVSITFKKNGKLSFVGFNTKGEGTYKLTGRTFTILLSLRNGVKPTNTNESKANGEIAADGESIMMSTGMEREGKPVMIRLVRKK
ncbi:MAG TPA: hypothetical protein PLX06_04730 [Fimbriimonadaceae bacterium]|nr:hypothetical protein [Fimbriimonadaceae bacterium]